MSADKYSSLCLKYKIWLEDAEGTSIMGDGKYLLLKAIEKEGSLKAAIEKQKLDYRRTWGNLKKIEKLLGFNLLQRTRGGKDGGKTTLTDDGKKLILAFDEFHLKMDSVFSTAFKEFHEKLE
jgi:molybdate transport repressor ModE-like protein